MKTGAQLISDERERQISEEKWTPKHDDEHKRKELANAAESYLGLHTAPDIYALKRGLKPNPNWNWPWSGKWWKPSDDPIRNLVKAGALIAAEIDRLQRKLSAKLK